MIQHLPESASCPSWREATVTSPNVFIIESLEFKDERHGFFEGKLLSEILHLGGKKSEYFYIRTSRELEEVMEIFGNSDYRYLHLSCHGLRTSVSTTLDTIKLKELSRIIGPYLGGKRLFMSTCLAANFRIAQQIIPNFGVYSVVGPKGEVDFHAAAIAWASFYHLIFEENREGMKGRAIRTNLQRVSDTFRIHFNYFSRNKKAEKGYDKIDIIPGSYERISRADEILRQIEES
jgi:hypothetical protein